MKFSNLLLIFGLVCNITVQAQNNLGTINGTIYDAADSAMVLPFVKVWVITDAGMRAVQTNELGKYKIDALKPGSYNLHVKSPIYDSLTIVGITVSPNTITQVNGYCGNSLETVVVYAPIIIPGDIPKVEILKGDLKHTQFLRDPSKLLASTCSDIQMDEGSSQLIIRGARPGDAVFYIDGVKSTSMRAVPGVAIGSLEAYTGGIPVNYGDTTGGIVVIETKSYFDLYRAWLYHQ